ncbi:hypothetical protein BU16DRAFT_169167 [Lophium mytilinum]|uniref:Uncharacterized protein n=1 Tax=Lophium mytilinum TaxID=390894 RepID=A0A6A6QDF0_9PEZI|nr:hypothetical protein BU16DRAFT_169167 [Lophium mytilinum]
MLCPLVLCMSCRRLWSSGVLSELPMRYQFPQDLVRTSFWLHDGASSLARMHSFITVWGGLASFLMARNDAFLSHLKVGKRVGAPQTVANRCTQIENSSRHAPHRLRTAPCHSPVYSVLPPHEVPQ